MKKCSSLNTDTSHFASCWHNENLLKNLSEETVTLKEWAGLLEVLITSSIKDEKLNFPMWLSPYQMLYIGTNPMFTVLLKLALIEILGVQLGEKL